MADRSLSAARIVTPDGERAGTIVIHDGLIAELRDDPLPGTENVDVPAGHVVLPGLVDSHVHVNEPGRTEWEGFATATAAAAAGGVTTIVDMPLNSIPATVDVAALAQKQAAADGRLAVDVAFWGGAVPGNAGELRALHDAGVVGFKCFLLPSGVAEFPPLDPDGLGAAMDAIAGFDGLLIAHAEDDTVINAAPAAHGRHYADFVASRPEAAEVSAIAGLLEQTNRTGCRTHIVHLSSATALPVIKAAKAAGLPVTVETCPHYLTLRAEDVPDGATQFKCCPPIRDDANRELLWAGLLDGTIDLIASDHSPCPPAAKHLDTGDFGAAWGGISSVQLALPVVWTEAATRGVATERRQPLAGRGPGRPDRAPRPRHHRARATGRPVRVRPGRALRRRPGPAAPAPPAHPVRRPGAVRRRGPDVVAWSADPRRRPARAARPRPEGARATMAERGGDRHRLPDLAGAALGGSVVYANDETFAPAHNLIAPSRPTHDPASFSYRGKVYDGWETRRRRTPGEDFAVVRLAAPGIVHAVDIDTTHFTGNFPQYASVEATTVLGYPSVEELLAAEWTALVDKTALAGDSANLAPVTAPDRLATHLRLTIHPDGGVARFRAYGEVVPDPRRLGGRVDLAAAVLGGRVEACSNMFYAAPANVLAPGRAQVMSDGWETARRRDDGNDWLTVRLAAPGVLHHAVIDTTRFVGNAPGWARLSDDDTGAELLPRTRLQPDTEHRFAIVSPDPVQVVRLDIYPDGGISRLRLHGAVPADRHDAITQRWLGLLPPDQAAAVAHDKFFD